MCQKVEWNFQMECQSVSFLGGAEKNVLSRGGCYLESRQITVCLAYEIGRFESTVFKCWELENRKISF